MLRARGHDQRAGLGDAGKGAGDRDMVGWPRRGRGAATASSGWPSRRRRAAATGAIAASAGRLLRARYDTTSAGTSAAATRATVALLVSAHWQNSATFSGWARLARATAGPRGGSASRASTALALGARELAATERAADAVQDLRARIAGASLMAARRFVHCAWNVPPGCGAGKSRKRVQPPASGRVR